MLKAVAHLLDQVHGFRLGYGPVAFQPLAQGFAFDELHDEERVGAGAAELDRPHDVRMVQHLGGEKLALEPLKHHRVAGGAGRNHFDRHDVAGDAALRPIDGAHPAFGDFRQHIVVAECGRLIDRVRVHGRSVSVDASGVRESYSSRTSGMREFRPVRFPQEFSGSP